MAYTAQDIINVALWQLRILGPGETLSAAQNADLLKALNVMIGRWNADTSLQLALNGYSFPLQAAKGLYTIGPTTADWIGPRPIRIDAVNLLLPQGGINTRIPIHLDTQLERFASNPSNIQAPYPSEVAYYPFFDANGNGTLAFWPVPTIASTIELMYALQITPFAALTTPLALPDYYAEALASNVALRYAPMFKKPQDPAIIANAASSLQLIRTASNRTLKRTPTSGGLYWNYRTGEMESA